MIIQNSMRIFGGKPLFQSDKTTNLKQNEALTAHAESANKGVNKRSKHVTQAQQQRPESPTVTLTWHACNLCYIFRALMNSLVCLSTKEQSNNI